MNSVEQRVVLKTYPKDGQFAVDPTVMVQGAFPELIEARLLATEVENVQPAGGVQNGTLVLDVQANCSSPRLVVSRTVMNCRPLGQATPAENDGPA
jgi:hypothetical protein